MSDPDTPRSDEKDLPRGGLTEPLTELASESNVVYQAVGFVGATYEVPADTALTLLREEARTVGMGLPDLARAIVTRRHPLPARPDSP